MKKVIKTACFLMLLLPAVLLFVLYEPYNYWGLRKVRGDMSSSVTVLREIENNQCDNIIISNSRLAALSTDYLLKEGILQEKWVNLSLVGCSIREACKTFWETVSKSEIRKVIFTISYSLFNMPNETYRFTEDAYALAEDPVTFITSLQTRDAVINAMLHRLPVSQFLAVNTYEKSILTEATEEEWKQLYASYIERSWEPYTGEYKFSSEGLADIIEVINYCKSNDIELFLVTLPMQRAVYDYIESVGEKAEMDFYKEYLSLYLPVYDMEYQESAWTDTFGLFGDGIHLNGINFANGENPVVSDLYKVLFEQNGSEMRILQSACLLNSIYKKTDVKMERKGKNQGFTARIPIEEDKAYLVRVKGQIPDMDRCVAVELKDVILSNGENAVKRKDYLWQIGDTGEYLAVLSTKGMQLPEALFSMTSREVSDIRFDSLEIMEAGHIG